MALMMQKVAAPVSRRGMKVVAQATPNTASRRAILGVALLPALMYAPKALALIPGESLAELCGCGSPGAGGSRYSPRCRNDVQIAQVRSSTGRRGSEHDGLALDGMQACARDPAGTPLPSCYIC